MKVKLLPLKAALTPVVMLSWSPELHRDIPKDLQKLPDGFPVLSVRGWKDPMISPAHIDKIFEQAPNIHWIKLGLPQAAHLNGLRDHPQEYRAGLESFLHSLP